jgi:hypothetical protein
MMITNKRRKGASTEVPAGQAEGGSGHSTPGEGLCDICGKQYRGKIGLSVHQRSAHAAVYHATHQVAAQSKKRWDPEEVSCLARKEARLITDGVSPLKINENLAQLHTERTLEAIKGRRRGDEYKTMVGQYVIEIDERKKRTNPVTHTQVDDRTTEWEEAFTQTVQQVITHSRDPGNDHLCDSLENALRALKAPNNNNDMNRAYSHIDKHAFPH